MSDDDWPEPWPRRRQRRRLRPRAAAHPVKRRVARPQRQRSLQDDRAETYCHYSCSTCDQDNSCCRCPDPRPQTPVPILYVIDMRDGPVRRLTHNETISLLSHINHEMWMEQYIGRSFWKGLIVDYNAWRNDYDPLHVRYARPKFSLFFDDEDDD